MTHVGTESDLLASAPAGELVEVSTIPALAPVSCLIGEHSTRDLFLAELPFEQRMLATEIFQCVTQLQETTAWDSDTLIHYLGCPTTDVGSFRDLSTEDLETCDAYVSQLRTLTGMVETAPDKRMLLLGHGHVYMKANRDINVVKKAFSEPIPESNAISAMEYLQLGEIQTALKTALVKIDPSYAYDGPSPFDGLPPVHISTGRLDVLVRGDEEELRTLGEQKIVPNMWVHLESCQGCGEALADRRRRLGRTIDSL